MIDPRPHQFEIGDTAATLYLTGAIDERDVERLRTACEALPPRVAILRVDFPAERAPASRTVAALHEMLIHWCDVRRGTCHMPAAPARAVA